MRLPKFTFLRHTYSYSTTSPLKPKPSKISSYLQSLRTKYPQADPPSLIISFLLLHELTAIIPLFIGFFTLKSLGVGEDLIVWISKNELHHSLVQGEVERERSLLGSGREKVGEWIEEGEKQAEMIGRRYGTFGFEKESKEDRKIRKGKEKEGEVLQIEELQLVGDGAVGGSKMAGDVANLVVAYIAVKATLPLRILLSARLSPVLANVIVTNFKGLRTMGMKYLKKSKV